MILFIVFIICIYYIFLLIYRTNLEIIIMIIGIPMLKFIIIIIK